MHLSDKYHKSLSHWDLSSFAADLIELIDILDTNRVEQSQVL